MKRNRIWGKKNPTLCYSSCVRLGVHQIYKIFDSLYNKHGVQWVIIFAQAILKGPFINIFPIKNRILKNFLTTCTKEC